MAGVASAALIEQGAEALRVGDATGALRAFEQAVVELPSGVALEGLAKAAYLAIDHRRAIENWELAYAAYREAADQVSAIRVARTVAYVHGSVVGDWAVANGWIGRAQTLLADDRDSVEVGWVALNLGMFEGARATKEEHFRTALEVARRLHDTDLEFVALAYLGASLVHDDRTEEGMLLLDEALAAVAGQDVKDFPILEEIFCQLFSACEHAHDITRADQWIRVGATIAKRRNLPSVAAFCRTHYGGVLTAAGRWSEAEATLTEATRLWSLTGQSGLRGGALLRLADLRVRQGRYEEADQLLQGLDSNDVAGSRAAILLARGETTLARDVLERALDNADPAAAATVPLLALLVEAHLTGGELTEAEDAATRVQEVAGRHGNRYLQATAALARGRVCLATGSADPLACLREALAGFERAQMPMEEARARFVLARALQADRPEVALEEARIALRGFERLQASRDVDAVAAFLRSMGVRAGGVRGTGVLTKREAEVLELLGVGLSNPDIAERLFISRKTVEHHVGNVLAKLGLRSRAEAAAHATRAEPGSA